MKTIEKNIFCFLAFILPFFACAQVGNASEKEPTAAEALFVQLINSARVNPLGLASSFGMDAEQILIDLPELNSILTEGLPPVDFDERLYNAASFHSEDMIRRGYYASKTPEGDTVEDRLFVNNYFPVASDESLRMIRFANFMDAQKAAYLIFERMFEDELRPGNIQRNIFDPNMKDVGVSIRPGTFAFEGTVVNIYVAVCDFGNDDTTQIERSVADTINSARLSPKETVENLGLEMESTVVDAFFEQGPMPVMEWNGSLYLSAKNHLNDLADRVYFSNISPEGLGPLDRVWASEYDAVYIGEVLGAMVLEGCFVPPEEAAEVLTQAFIKAELLGEKNVFFNNRVKHVGIRFQGVAFDLGEGNFLRVYLMIGEVGTDSTLFSPIIPEENFRNLLTFSGDYFGDCGSD